MIKPIKGEARISVMRNNIALFKDMIECAKEIGDQDLVKTTTDALKFLITEYLKRASYSVSCASSASS